MPTINRDYLTPLTAGGLQCRPNRTMTPTSITIHNTGNPDANALQHAKAQSKGELASMQMAVHYYVDDTNTVYQCLEDTWQGWHAADGSAPQGGNYTSIAIEICEQKGIDQYRAFEVAAQLVAGLCAHYGWQATETYIKQHYDWKSAKYPTGKDCPYHLRHNTAGLDWNGFLKLCQGGQATTPPATPPSAPPPVTPPPATGQTAHVTTSQLGLNLRAAAGTNAAVLLTIPKGATVQVLGAAQNGWRPVAYGGKQGYVSEQYITLDAASTPPPSSWPQPGQCTTTQANLNLRAGAGTNAAVIGSIPPGAAVQLLAPVSNGWQQISYDGKTGYASAEYLKG